MQLFRKKLFAFFLTAFCLLFAGNGFSLQVSNSFNWQELTTLYKQIKEAALKLNESTAKTKEVDLFLIAGQSNAQGRGEGSNIEIPFSQGMQWNGANFQEIEDVPAFGSAWPAFAKVYYQETGHIPALVNAAKGGSSLTTKADSGEGHWNKDGELFSLACKEYNHAFKYLKKSNYQVKQAGVLWAQGENDAIYLEHHARLDYKDKLDNLIKRFQKRYNKMPFYLFQTGKRAYKESSGFKKVRKIQTRVARQAKGVRIVFKEAKYFDESNMNGAFHYNQKALNYMGRMSASKISELQKRK